MNSSRALIRSTETAAPKTIQGAVGARLVAAAEEPVALIRHLLPILREVRRSRFTMENGGAVSLSSPRIIGRILMSTDTLNIDQFVITPTQKATRKKMRYKLENQKDPIEGLQTWQKKWSAVSPVPEPVPEGEEGGGKVKMKNEDLPPTQPAPDYLEYRTTFASRIDEGVFVKYTETTLTSEGTGDPWTLEAKVDAPTPSENDPNNNEAHTKYLKLVASVPAVAYALDSNEPWTISVPAIPTYHDEVKWVTDDEPGWHTDLIRYRNDHALPYAGESVATGVGFYKEEKDNKHSGVYLRGDVQINWDENWHAALTWEQEEHWLSRYLVVITNTVTALDPLPGETSQKYYTVKSLKGVIGKDLLADPDHPEGYKNYTSQTEVTTLPVEVITPAEGSNLEGYSNDLVPAAGLRIAKMETSLDQNHNLHIDKDPDRFFVRIRGCARFDGLTNIKAKISTAENPATKYDNKPTFVKMFAKGDDIVTNSLLLVADEKDDIYTNSEIGADDVDDVDDRTLRVQLGGKFKITALVILARSFRFRLLCRCLPDGV